MCLKKKRYLFIFWPVNSKIVDLKSAYITTGVCFAVGLFCAAAPLFGWSYYSMEGALTSCSVEWSDRSFNVVSYNVFIFVFTFLIPLIIISMANLSIVFIVNKNIYKIFLFKLRTKLNKILY